MSTESEAVRRAYDVVVEEHRRDPLPHEYPSRRLSLIAGRH